MDRPAIALPLVVLVLAAAVGPAIGTQSTDTDRVVVTLDAGGDADLDRTAAVLRERLDAAGYDATVAADDGGLTATTTANATEALRGWLTDRGRVRVTARYPTDGGVGNRTLLTNADLTNVGSPSESRAGGWTVPVTMSDAGRENFTTTLAATGFLDEGVGDCDASTGEGHCLVNTVDGEVSTRASISAGLADAVRSDEFDGRFLFLLQNRTTARRVSTYLRAGELPASLSVTAVEPATTATAAEDDGGSAGVGPGFDPVTTVLAAALVVAALVARRLR